MLEVVAEEASAHNRVQVLKAATKLRNSVERRTGMKSIKVVQFLSYGKDPTTHESYINVEDIVSISPLGSDRCRVQLRAPGGINGEDHLGLMESAESLRRRLRGPLWKRILRFVLSRGREED